VKEPGDAVNVRVYIERLILDGVAVPYGQRPQLQAAVEAELGRLLAAGGLASGLAQGAALPAVAGGSIQLAQANEPLILGRQIARTAYAAIGMLETSRSGQTRRA
jgi:hypothetical protein